MVGNTLELQFGLIKSMAREQIEKMNVLFSIKHEY